MKVYIIGGGPAGMLAAWSAAESGQEVVLIEKNEKLGKKLYITGKGRCNLTNCSSFDDFMEHITSNRKFLFGALRKFGSEDTMRLFEDNGCSLKVERGNRVFPTSDKSNDVLKTLNAMLKKRNVRVHLSENVQECIANNDRIISIVTDKNRYDDVGNVVLATGGVSYPATGSTGDGYRFATRLGHEIVRPVPSLIGLKNSAVLVKNQKIPIVDLPRLQGLSLKNVRMNVQNRDNGKTLYSEFGEMLFTDGGMSGPIILTLSSLVNRMDFQNLHFVLDLKPALTISELDARILRDFNAASNKQFKNALSQLLPTSMIPFIVRLSGINPDKGVHSVTAEERKSLAFLLKNVVFLCRGTENIESAIVTSGGVSVQSVDPSSMRSKIIRNLFFAGELLDVDAQTGGYNIQIALSTGICAGKNASKLGEE